MICPQCGIRTGQCVECFTPYPLGSTDVCDQPDCAEAGCVVACKGCGLAVSKNLDGVLSLDGALLEWIKEEKTP